MASFTYFMVSLTDIWNLSRDFLAIALNPVPGNQSGRYRTVGKVPSVACRCCSGESGRTDGDNIDEVLSGHHSGRKCICCLEGCLQEWIFGRLDVDPVSYGQYDGSRQASGVK